MSVIQIRCLFDAEIPQYELSSDIEWRLIQIGYKQMRFGRIRDRHGQSTPWAKRV